MNRENSKDQNRTMFIVPLKGSFAQMRLKPGYKMAIKQYLLTTSERVVQSTIHVTNVPKRFSQ